MKISGKGVILKMKNTAGKSDGLECPPPGLNDYGMELSSTPPLPGGEIIPNFFFLSMIK